MGNDRKQCREMEKMLVTSISPFPCIVFHHFPKQIILLVFFSFFFYFLLFPQCFLFLRIVKNQTFVVKGWYSFDCFQMFHFYSFRSAYTNKLYSSNDWKYEPIASRKKFISKPWLGGWYSSKISTACFVHSDLGLCLPHKVSCPFILHKWFTHVQKKRILVSLWDRLQKKLVKTIIKMQ